MIQKSFLKWAGGKRSSLVLIKDWIDINQVRYIEPFAGSAVVFMNVDFSENFICDVNCDLINLYNVLKENGSEFVDYCETFFTVENNEAEKFYELRSKFNSTDDVVEKSALFVYLNRHAFNGLCRYNKKGEYNVPFGKYDFPGFPRDEMMAFYYKSYRAEFECQDFGKALDDLTEEDMVYCDPPYVPLSETASFTDYATEGFTAEDQKRLVVLAEKRICPFLISNHDTDETRELYKNADFIREKEIKRTISGQSVGRGKVKELLAIYLPRKG